jgi:hypothetical protein
MEVPDLEPDGGFEKTAKTVPGIPETSGYARQ